MPRHELFRRLPLAAALAAAVLASTLLAAPPASADVPPPTGRTSADAAASCWEAKLNDPAASDGIYWLLTPTLQAPEQFYCDMTTDGGGWVLIARGREGWKSDYVGQGTAAEVRGSVTGQSAFRVRQLPSKTVDGLLDGRRVDALSDGVRFRRAADTAGATWQESRFRYTSRDRWVWSLGAEHRVGTFSFNGVSGSGGQTNNFGSDSAFRRVDTRETQAQGYTWGIAYGSGVSGTNTADSYLWSSTTGAGSARPFTQAFIRPRLTQADLTFPLIPDVGIAASQNRPLFNSGAETSSWGVTGLANGVNTELTTEVAAFAQIGGRVYVGGNFRYVQQGASGAGRVEQSYLAAFDVATREWIPGFRPTFNGQVKALAALPDGRLAVGGEFSTVNGATRRGIVALDAGTGATFAGWTVTLENRISGGSIWVRGLSVQGSNLYLAGSFTHLRGGSQTNAVYARSGARVNVANGTADGTWNPNFNGTAVAVHASPQGDRAYFSGYFTQANGVVADEAAAVSTAAGAALAQPAWNIQHSSAKSYQQAVREVGGKVWIGGSEHNLFSYDRNTFARTSGNITKQGGDFQAIADSRGIVYAGCHCNEWNYSNAFTWSNVGTGWTQADRIGHIAALDASTGQVIPEFVPNVKGRRGAGPWAMFPDSTGRLWIGGDFISAVRTNGTGQWVGGFATFASADSLAPSTPGSLTSSQPSTGTTRLAWGASTDGGGGLRYEVLRGDRVIATTTARTFDVPTPTEPTRYAVRAADAAGNRSASTAVLTVTPEAEEPVDTQAPSAPSALAVGAIGGEQVDLIWTASTDNLGVVGYRIVRDGEVEPTLLTGTAATDTGLTPGTEYSYTVRAYDAAGNESGDSNIVTVSTTDEPAPPPLFEDGWTGADGAAWGPAWATTTGSGSATTQGGAGRLAYDDAAGAFSRALLSGPAALQDSEVVFSYRWEQNAPTAYLNVFLRGSGDWQNAYRPRSGYGLQLSANSTTVSVQKNVNSTTSTIRNVGSAQAVTTDKQWLRLRVSGSQIQFRTWVDGQPEPASWTATENDAGVTAPGQLFISLVRAGSNVGAKSVSIDDLTLREVSP